MKVELIIYRILSFFLLPVAVLLGILCLAVLPIALSFPPALINLFLLVCVVIYIISSSIFLNKGITSRRKCKPVLRDLLRINGIITLIFFLLTLISFFVLKSHPELLDKSLQQWTNSTYLPAGTSEKDLRNSMTAASNFFMGLSIVTIVHILITFHLLSRYRFLFLDDDINMD